MGSHELGPRRGHSVRIPQVGGANRWPCRAWRMRADVLEPGEADARGCTTRAFSSFEFLLGFMLRRRQFELVMEFFQRAMEGHSSVNQMIMGQGKTTVIAPLLALMLADSRRLVTQVCPAPLLEMSRSALRTVFSNVIHKRIYTFKFERSNAALNSLEGVQGIYFKLHHAREQRAVVCSTPEAIKSFMLKYIDNLQMVEGAPVQAPPPSEPAQVQGAEAGSERGGAGPQRPHG